MKQGALQRFARVVTGHPGWVIASVLAVTIAAAAQFPRLTADFTPSDLFAKFEDQERIAREFRETYGNTDNILLVLVQSDDVLDPPVIRFVHELTLTVQELDAIRRVESITVTNLPRLAEAARPATPEGGDGEQGQRAPPDTEADGEGEADTSQPSAPPPDDLASALLGALRRPVEAVTGSSSGSGDLTLRVATGAVKVDNVIEGPDVSDEEAAALREVLRDAPLVEGRLVSQDRTLTAIAIYLSSENTRNDEIAAVVEEIQGALDSADVPEAAQVKLAGLPYVRYAVVQKMKADQSVLLPAAIVVCLLILLGAFRWVWAGVLPLAAVLMSTVVLVGGMAVFGEPFNIVNNIVPMLIIIIGISYAIHLINRYGEELARGDTPQEAAADAITHMAAALFLTAFTTAVGFFSLAVSQTEVLRRFGIVAGIGILLAYVATLTMIPPLLAWVKPPEHIARATQEGRLEAWIERLTRALLRRPWPVVVIALGGIIPLGFVASDLRVDNAVLDQLDAEDEVYRTTKLIEEKLVGVRPIEISLTSDTEGTYRRADVLNALEEFRRWVIEKEGVLRSAGLSDYLREAWYLQSGDLNARQRDFESAEQVRALTSVFERSPKNPLSSYTTPDGERARVNVQIEDMGAQATLRLTDEIESKLDELLGPFDAVEYQLTGDAYIGSRGLDVVIRDLIWSLFTAVLIIFGFMTIVLRSFRLGLLSVPPNVIPLVGTMAYMVLRDVPLNAATAIIFSVSIGMAVDGTIHVLARFREETSNGYDAESALVRAARGTGKAIILTCVALMLGFGVMMLSSFVPVRRFGELIAVTIFSTLIGTIIVLPALLRVGWKGLRTDDVAG